MKRLSRNVVALGVVSGLTDISSEMLYPVVPLFLTAVLGAPMSVVGAIEGAAEATASLLKAAGGVWSDRLGARKPFVVAGYGLSAVSKPLMALAGGWPAVLAARLLDRTGKGLRTAPRDALLAASADKQSWGLAFGFHRAMDTAGAVVGPLLALFLLERAGWGYRGVFAFALAPALLSVLVAAWVVRDVPATVEERAAEGLPAPPLTRDFKRFAVFYGVFALGNSSDVFLLMKAKRVGFSTSGVILAYVLYNLVYAVAATPAGALSDRLGRRRALALGLAVFAAAYLGFALASTPSALWALFALYGVYAALAEGAVKAVAAELSLPGNRGTAMGVLQGLAGLLALAASVGAGQLWTRVSPAAPFVAGAACAAAAAVLIAAGARVTYTPA